MANCTNEEKLDMILTYDECREMQKPLNACTTRLVPSDQIFSKLAKHLREDGCF